MSLPLECGDVVWARQRGYPWWPAVLAPCPEIEKGLAVKDPNVGEWKVGESKKRTKLHCIFLAWNRERAWLSESQYRKFEEKDAGEGRKKDYKVTLKQYRDSHLEAIELALELLQDLNNPMAHLVKHDNEYAPPVVPIMI